MRQTLTLFLILLVFGASAQEGKTVIGVAPFSFSSRTVKQGYAEVIFNYVINSLDKTKRFKVLDRLYGPQVITIEKELNKGQDFVDGVAVDQGKQMGAQYMVFGRVNSATCFRNSNGNYEGNVSLFIRIFNVETGEVEASEIITPYGRSELKEFVYSDASESLEQFLGDNTSIKIPKWLKVAVEKRYTCEESMDIALKRIQPEIQEFVEEKFPLELKIFKISGDKVKVIGNEDMGITLNSKLNVIRVDKVRVGDRYLYDEEEIGTLVVKKFSGDFVTCEFKEGKSAISNLFNKSPEKITLRENAKKKKNLINKWKKKL